MAVSRKCLLYTTFFVSRGAKSGNKDNLEIIKTGDPGFMVYETYSSRIHV